MKSYSLLLFLFVHLMTSCQNPFGETEEEQYTNTVTGYVLTTDSLDPIPNITLDLWVRNGTHKNPDGGTQIKSDSTGKFEIIFTGPKDGRIGIGFGGSKKYQSYGGWDFVYPYETQKHNIELQPYGWLKLHVKNVNPWSGDDFFGVSAGSSHQVLYGVNDKTFLWQIGGNRYLPITWTTVKNNISQNFSDTIYLPGFDTAYYEILY